MKPYQRGDVVIIDVPMLANSHIQAGIYALLNVVEEKDMSVVIGDNEIGHSYDRYKEKRGRQVSTGVFANAY